MLKSHSYSFFSPQPRKYKQENIPLKAKVLFSNSSSTHYRCVKIYLYQKIKEREITVSLCNDY